MCEENVRGGAELAAMYTALEIKVVLDIYTYFQVKRSKM